MGDISGWRNLWIWIEAKRTAAPFASNQDRQRENGDPFWLRDFYLHVHEFLVHVLILILYDLVLVFSQVLVHVFFLFRVHEFVLQNYDHGLDFLQSLDYLQTL